MKTIPAPHRVFRSRILIAAGCALSVATLQAATIDQRIAGTTQIGWNDVTLWGNGSDPVTNANDYQTESGFFSPATTDVIINGQTWSYSGQVRTAPNTSENQANTAFNGNSLIVNATTRVIGKNYNDSTMSANMVLNGGYFYYSPDGSNRAGTLAGAISFGNDSDIGAIIVKSNSGFNTLTVTSTISGDASKTLQLGMHGGQTNELILTGDMSNFFGTIYAGVTGVYTTSSSSFFSIQTDALNATLQLDAWANINFRYNLGSANQTFGSVVLNPSDVDNGPIALTAGQTYSADDLNSLLEGGSKFFGTGTITVVPEPGTVALSAIGLLGMLAMFYGRRIHRTA